MTSDVIEVRGGWGPCWSFKEEWADGRKAYRVWIGGKDRGLHESWYNCLKSQGIF